MHRRFLSFVAVIFLLGFCLGLGRLFVLRYSTGDVFPHYSTLRADPLGAKIFYESLRELPEVVVRQNLRPLARLHRGEGTTLFLLGTNRIFISDRERDAIEHFVQSGGRLVLALYPKYDAPTRKAASPTPSPSPSPSPSAEPKPTPVGSSLTEVLKRWDIKLKEDRDDKDNVALLKLSAPLEKNLSWHSGVAFESKAEGWRTIYECRRGPVVIERAFGAGTVVLASDSFFISNEALLLERAPAFLAWLVGDNREIVFDESHLNVREDPSIATLLRRYGLSGFVIGLLMLIALWLWRNATFFLVRRSSAPVTDDVVSGRDSFSGFVQLLRRGIAPDQLLHVCLAEWKKSARVSAEKADSLQAAAQNSSNPVDAYNHLSALAAPKKWKPTPAR